MTDILCKWLNAEVKLSHKIDATNFAREFATGFLIGEVLNRYQLQDDFDKFSLSRTADSKLNNFMRVEPTIHLLEVPFDTNIARDIMTEKLGVATRVMYQLFIALEKKQKNNLTGIAMESMRPAAPAKLENVESVIYKERLKHMTPRQTDLNLEALVDRFHLKQIEMEKVAFKERFEEEEKNIEHLQQKRQQLIQKYKDNQTKKSEMLAKIHFPSAEDVRAATVHIPKPPPSNTAKAIAHRRAQRRQLESQHMQKDIEAFENKMMRTLPPSKPMGDHEHMVEDEAEVARLPDSLEYIRPQPNDEYIGKISKRLNEDASARAEREKRRRKVLVDQLKAHEAQEEARREEMLVNRLMRQSQQERRIAVQLLQARHEKDVIRSNRLQCEKQYEDRRLQQFEEALNREAEMARLAKLEYIEQTQKDRDLHDRLMAERAEARYKKHYDMCGGILSDILDFSTKVGEYRELTNRALPAKLMREWTTLFTEGEPLYEVTQLPYNTSEEPTPEQILEEERQQLLDEGDFNEYRHMMGEWVPPEGCEILEPPRSNPIVGHIVKRLFDLVHPPSPQPPAPEFPAFPIKACVLGKCFSGKTSICNKLAENHRLCVLNVDTLVAEAIEAHKNGEVEQIEEEEPITEDEQIEAQLGEVTDPASESVTQADTVSSAVEQQDGKTVSSQPLGSVTEVQDNRQIEQQSAQKVDEGAAKMDPEKPVEDDKSSQNVKSMAVSRQVSGVHSSTTVSQRSLTPAKPQATPRAKLGAKALKLLKKGRGVDDQLMTDALVEAIRRVPEDTGYILDSFPATYAQAKLLEKALSGVDISGPDSRENSKSNLKAKAGKKSSLAPDPRPAPPPPEPSSGINVVIHFDLANDLCLRRSAGRTYASQHDEEYQQEFNPPPEGSATGISKQERVLPVEDAAHDQEQIQHRLTSFQDAWPKMEKFFMRFGTLQKVDASQEGETVYLEVENILEETLNKLQGQDQEESVPVENTEPKEEEKPPEPEVVPEPAVAPAEEGKDRSRPTSKKGSRTGSAKRSGSRGSADKKDKGSRSGSAKGDKDAGKKAGKGSRGSSPKSPKRGKSGTKKSKTPEPEPEPEPLEPTGPPPPAPGSDEWEYVDQPIDPELAAVLAMYWEGMENNYIKADKAFFRKIREERESIIRYLYEIRQTFLAYLRRPDSKQEFVTQWQKEFNLVSDDLREDDETRSELHQRVDDLRERLWSICDDRKEAAEKERESVMGDGWVDDRLGVLSNHYVSIMQEEVDRFQDTVRTLKDYYRGMEGKIPDESSQDFIRLPLIELPVEQLQDEDCGSEAAFGEGGEGVTPTPSQEEVKGVNSKTGTPSGKKKDAAPENTEEEKKSRIPLVPRRPGSPDPAGAKGKVEKVKGKEKGVEEMPPPPQDPDERLIFEAYWTGAMAIDKVLAAEQAAKEAEEEAERQRELEKEQEKQKAAAAVKGKGGKGGKGGKKSRSPSPKKGKGEKNTPTQPTPPPVEESEEEKEKKKIKENARQEFFAAVTEEVQASKIRMDLVKSIAFGVLTHLKGKADCAYKNMDDWLGARFLKEMESIDHMSEVMRFCVEDGKKIKEELVLQQEDFLVNEDVKVLKTPSPVPRPPAVEHVLVDAFTVNQIKTIYNQFALTAPSGLLSIKAFQEMFQDLSMLSHGTESIPDLWNNLMPDKLELMSLQLTADGEYIDWRAFLLHIAQPWPSPSQSNLLQTLTVFKDIDQDKEGFVTREQFEHVELWFKDNSTPETPMDPQEPLPYDRTGELKAAFFDIFADHSLEPPQMDYISMLLYFSVSSDPYEGFLRGLSVAAGTHMPRLPNKKIEIRKPSRPSSQASLAVSVDLDVKEAVHEDEYCSEEIPENAAAATVPLESLYRVLHHGQNTRGDSHRFSVTTDPEDAFSKERLAGVYQELGSDTQDPVPFCVLVEHPIVQDMIGMCNTYRTQDLKAILMHNFNDNADTQSQTMKLTE